MGIQYAVFMDAGPTTVYRVATCTARAARNFTPAAVMFSVPPSCRSPLRNRTPSIHMLLYSVFWYPGIYEASMGGNSSSAVVRLSPMAMAMLLAA